MIDIGQGLYVHPDDLAVVLSKADGQKMVRKLMNIVFKKEDLEQGATLSPTGKGKLLDQRTVDVMLGKKRISPQFSSSGYCYCGCD